MGRNFPSASELVRQVIADLEHFGNMLSPQDRMILNRYYELALNNRGAIANAASLMPLEAMLLLFLLEEHKANAHTEAELRAEIRALRQAINGEPKPGF